MKGSYYSYTNEEGQTVVVLCTKDPVDTIGFDGVVVAVELGDGNATWKIGDYAQNWNQKVFKLAQVEAPIRALASIFRV